MYKNKDGCPKDDKEALEWYKKVAESAIDF
jgi:TPR repeat protein